MAQEPSESQDRGGKQTSYSGRVPKARYFDDEEEAGQTNSFEGDARDKDGALRNNKHNAIFINQPAIEENEKSGVQTPEFGQKATP